LTSPYVGFPAQTSDDALVHASVMPPLLTADHRR
jgi:hypothetical protein